MIVIDANILVRAILGRRVRDLIEISSHKGIRFSAPDLVFHEAERHLPPLIEKFARRDIDLSVALQYLRQLIEIIQPDIYSMFEGEARKRLRGRDEEDWPVLASALALGCAIWTEDSDFFGTGVALWNTAHIEIFLESEVRSIEIEEETE
jgi:predicted nucleic acid-binding protein